MFKWKPFQVTVWILVLLLCIFIGTKVSFVFYPIAVLITTLFFPVLISGLFYYLANPLVDFMLKYKIPRIAAILLIYLLIIGIVVFVLAYVGPILQVQAIALIDTLPELIKTIQHELSNIYENILFPSFQNTDILEGQETIDYTVVVENAINAILNNFSYLLGLITNIMIVSLTIPFILFYMLKDGHKLPNGIASLASDNYKKQALETINEMSSTISLYVRGQLIICLLVGIMVFIGYSIIGINYSLLLALFAAITNIIPYFGPIIGIIPGVFIGFMVSPWTAVQVLIMVVIVQQIESQLIAPQVLGKRLQIHPVTIIFVLLTGGSLAGFLGLILAVPTYAVGKVVLTHLYPLIKTYWQETRP